MLATSMRNGLQGTWPFFERLRAQFQVALRRFGMTDRKDVNFRVGDHSAVISSSVSDLPCERVNGNQRTGKHSSAAFSTFAGTLKVSRFTRAARQPFRVLCLLPFVRDEEAVMSVRVKPQELAILS